MATSNQKTTKSVTINYTDPAIGQNPNLQIINSPAGSNGQLQFANSGRFGSSSNLVWNSTTQTLGILGNLRVTGNISGKYSTNPTNFKLAGGSPGYFLTTDGFGTVSWANIQTSTFGTANVAAYLPTYSGNIKVSNLLFVNNTVQNTAWTGTIAVANVTGIGNISAINLDGNASNLLTGSGSFAAIPAAYVLPEASTTVVGGVKIDGSTITILDGVISSTGVSGDYVTFAQMQEYINNLINIDGGNASQAYATTIDGGNA